MSVCIRCGAPMYSTGINNVCSLCFYKELSSHAAHQLDGKITICGGPGKQVKSIVEALRGLADALEALVVMEAPSPGPTNWIGEEQV